MNDNGHTEPKAKILTSKSSKNLRHRLTKTSYGGLSEQGVVSTNYKLQNIHGAGLHRSFDSPGMRGSQQGCPTHTSTAASPQSSTATEVPTRVCPTCSYLNSVTNDYCEKCESYLQDYPQGSIPPSPTNTTSRKGQKRDSPDEPSDNSRNDDSSDDSNDDSDNDPPDDSSTNSDDEPEHYPRQAKQLDLRNGRLNPLLLRLPRYRTIDMALIEKVNKSGKPPDMIYNDGFTYGAKGYGDLTDSALEWIIQRNLLQSNKYATYSAKYFKLTGFGTKPKITASYITITAPKKPKNIYTRLEPIKEWPAKKYRNSKWSEKEEALRGNDSKLRARYAADNGIPALNTFMLYGENLESQTSRVSHQTRGYLCDHARHMGLLITEVLDFSELPTDVMQHLLPFCVNCIDRDTGIKTEKACQTLFIRRSDKQPPMPEKLAVGAHIDGNPNELPTIVLVHTVYVKDTEEGLVLVTPKDKESYAQIYFNGNTEDGDHEHTAKEVRSTYSTFTAKPGTYAMQGSAFAHAADFIPTRADGNLRRLTYLAFIEARIPPLLACAATLKPASQQTARKHQLYNNMTRNKAIKLGLRKRPLPPSWPNTTDKPDEGSALDMFRLHPVANSLKKALGIKNKHPKGTRKYKEQQFEQNYIRAVFEAGTQGSPEFDCVRHGPNTYCQIELVQSLNCINKVIQKMAHALPEEKRQQVENLSDATNALTAAIKQGHTATLHLGPEDNMALATSKGTTPLRIITQNIKKDDLDKAYKEKGSKIVGRINSLTIWTIGAQNSDRNTNRVHLLRRLPELQPFLPKAHQFNYAVALNITNLETPATHNCTEMGSGALIWKPLTAEITQKIKEDFKKIANKASTDNAARDDALAYANETVTTMSARPAIINIDFKPMSTMSQGNLRSRAIKDQTLPRAAKPRPHNRQR